MAALLAICIVAVIFGSIITIMHLSFKRVERRIEAPLDYALIEHLEKELEIGEYAGYKAKMLEQEKERLARNRRYRSPEEHKYALAYLTPEFKRESDTEYLKQLYAAKREMKRKMYYGN